MEQEKRMTEAESLELISSMINRAKNRFSENGFQYLLWGWAVLICCVIQYVMVNLYHNDNGYMIWSALWLVAIYQIYYNIKKKKKQNVHTYTDEIVKYIWIAFFVALALVLFICQQIGVQQIIYRLLLALYGIPVFLMGGLIRFKPLILGAICCWILAAISPFIASESGVLLIAVAIIAAWIVPGYLMGRRHRNEVMSRI